MNNLTRWDPIREMMAWRNAMDRMFDRDISAPDAWMETDSWNLALDVAETDNEFLVKASLPGIKPEELEITYDANMLTIKGETKEEKEFRREALSPARAPLWQFQPEHFAARHGEIGRDRGYL